MRRPINHHFTFWSCSTPPSATIIHHTFHPRHITNSLPGTNPSSLNFYLESLRFLHLILHPLKSETNRAKSTSVYESIQYANLNMSAEPEHVESKPKVKPNLK